MTFPPTLTPGIVVGSEGSVESTQSEPTADARGGISAEQAEQITHWVRQLASDQYLRREKATRWLTEAGADAVPVIVEHLDGGDLELTRRAIDVLQRVAFSGDPGSDGGAWEALREIARNGVGSRASRAALAVDEVTAHRGTLARETLAADGVFVGTARFVVLALSSSRQIVEIDDNWNGDVENLRWLRWVTGVSGARVQGKAIRADVIEKLIQMPNLTTITLFDGELNENVLAALSKADQLRDLEFRYVPLKAEMGDQLASLPVRSSMSFMGTGIPSEVVDEMRHLRPQLQIDFRQGGFLGVSCATVMNICQVSDVIEGSGAQRAGLIPGDVIVGAGDAKVQRFEDLQDEINQHMPGDKLKIRFRRGAVIMETTAKLGRLEQQVRRLP